MRIESRPAGSRDRLKSEKKSLSGTSFLDTLKDMDNDNDLRIDPDEVTEHDMKNLAGLIEQIGDQLSREPTPELFVRYKKHIRLMVRIASDNLEKRETMSRPSLTKQKLYMTIENIDENLAAIAQKVMAGEKNRLHYLNLVQAIQGLIVDMVW